MTVSDIERWDPGSVREVFHAASSRAQAAVDAANGLATLPVFTSWGGVAATAAREAIGKTRKDLDAHGREAQIVANAARSAAEEIEHIKSDLASVKADAEAMGMDIDPMSGKVFPGRSVRDPMEALLEQQQLQPRVDRIVAEANLVDIALANAIHLADGSVPIPSDAAGRTEPTGAGAEMASALGPSESADGRHRPGGCIPGVEGPYRTPSAGRSRFIERKAGEHPVAMADYATLALVVAFRTALPSRTRNRNNLNNRRNRLKINRIRGVQRKLQRHSSSRDHLVSNPRPWKSAGFPNSRRNPSVCPRGLRAERDWLEGTLDSLQQLNTPSSLGPIRCGVDARRKFGQRDRTNRNLSGK